MRCACRTCGTYAVHSESMGLGCVCPACGRRCNDCLGMNTVLSREELKRRAADPALWEGFGPDGFGSPPPGEEEEHGS